MDSRDPSCRRQGAPRTSARGALDPGPVSSAAVSVTPAGPGVTVLALVFAVLLAASHALAAEECFWSLDAPMIRITTPHIPLPSADKLEDATIPSVERLVREIREKMD